MMGVVVEKKGFGEVVGIVIGQKWCVEQDLIIVVVFVSLLVFGLSFLVLELVKELVKKLRKYVVLDVDLEIESFLN